MILNINFLDHAKKKKHTNKYKFLEQHKKHSSESKFSYSNVTNAIISFSNHILKTEWGKFFINVSLQ